MPNNFVSLAEAIDNGPVFESLRKLIKESDVVTEFYKVFPDLNKIVVAAKVEKKILFLKVENPAWRSELKLKESLIVEKINKYFKDNRIDRIRFV